MYLFLLGYLVSLLLEYFYGYFGVTLRAFVSRLFDASLLSVFQVNTDSTLVTLKFSFRHASW